MTKTDATEHEPQQLLHLVFGGVLTDVKGITFKDLSKLDYVGMFPNYETALKAWRAASQASFDNAQMRYFVVHVHRLMEPETDHQH